MKLLHASDSAASLMKACMATAHSPAQMQQRWKTGCQRHMRRRSVAPWAAQRA